MGVYTSVHVCVYNIKHVYCTASAPGCDFSTYHVVTHLILTTALTYCYPHFTDMWCAYNIFLQYSSSANHAQPCILAEGVPVSVPQALEGRD